MAAADSPVILTPAEVSEKTRVAVQTLCNWRNLSKRGQLIGPRSFKLGRLVRYYEADVDRWVEALRAQGRAS
jgi:predicted DNA-binding transcriptional regulator AlpA